MCTYKSQCVILIIYQNQSSHIGLLSVNEFIKVVSHLLSFQLSNTPHCLGSIVTNHVTPFHKSFVKEANV